MSKEGVSNGLDKTQRVAQCPCPKSRKELQQFLGFANYYRLFVHHYATIAKPLHQLTEKNKAFVSSPSCQHAFEALCQSLITSQVLSFPDCSQPLILDTDAIDTGIGAVLSQVIEGKEKVISYASRCLSRTEQKYCHMA